VAIRPFKELIQKRAARDPLFAAALLREAIDSMLTGDVQTGEAVLRDYMQKNESDVNELVSAIQLGEADVASRRTLRHSKKRVRAICERALTRTASRGRIAR
jgi:hypothetical protein